MLRDSQWKRSGLTKVRVRYIGWEGEDGWKRAARGGGGGGSTWLSEH